MIEKVALAPWLPLEKYNHCDLMWLSGEDFQPLNTRHKFFTIRDKKALKDTGITELHVYFKGKKVWEIVI